MDVTMKHRVYPCLSHIIYQMLSFWKYPWTMVPRQISEMLMDHNHLTTMGRLLRRPNSHALQVGLSKYTLLVLPGVNGIDPDHGNVWQIKFFN